MSDRTTITPFPPICSYGVIGDGRTVALVSTNGAVEWLCLPNMDSAAIFAAILDRERGGTFEVRCATGHPGTSSYLGPTNILKTRFESDDGAFELIDCMPLATAQSHQLRPEREILRILRPLSGRPRVLLRFDPAPNYGRLRPRLRQCSPTTWSVRSGGALFLLRSDIPLRRDTARGLVAEEPLTHPVALSLSYARTAPAVLPSLGAAAETRLSETQAWWEGWASHCSYHGPYRDAVMRSALALKLLQFSLSGALVAAATTSLPEAIGAARNWDYRYCWLRDAAFILRGFVDLGFWREGKSFFNWLLHSTRLTQPHLQPLYTVFGGKNVSERTLEHLSGYEMSAPVHVGNAAADQFQLDVYGAVIGAARDFVTRGHHLEPGEVALLMQFGRAICARWRTPDKGIWEMRGAPRHYTYSKAMAWAGLNDLLWLAERENFEAPVSVFERERYRLQHRIMNHAVHPDGGYFKGAFDEDYIDAALLLLPRLRFIDAHHPVMEATWAKIQSQLEHQGLIRRYGAGVDNLAGKEATFVACTFWAVDYLTAAGRLNDAVRYFERMLAHMSHLGLCSEEFDPASGTMLGNFPQAFSHTGLINAALALETVRTRGRDAQ